MYLYGCDQTIFVTLLFSIVFINYDNVLEAVKFVNEYIFNDIIDIKFQY